MSKINVLPKEVFNRISAGEVVERPASVVKELFENAVDAGAKSIVISIDEGGTEEILVQDDGSGIEKDDLKKAFLPHATSKVEKAEDLDFIQTLGFRGEALASIGAVSYAKILSKTENGEAYQINCDGGVIGEVREVSGVTGTSVTIGSLFFNTPARLKFLKSAKGEEREISSLVDKLILSNPYIAVKYYVDGILQKQSYGDGLKDAVLTVYGKEALDNCYEISTDKNGLFIRGFIGNSNYYKGNRTYQTIIVNGRYVTDNTVSMAVQNAYSDYLMKRQYPFYILNITIDPSVVDVNVHPRKSEIRFANNQIVYGSVYSVISKVLEGSAKALDIVDSAPFIENNDKKEESDVKGYVRYDEKVSVPPIELGNPDAYNFDRTKYSGDTYAGNYDFKPMQKPVAQPFSDIRERKSADFANKSESDLEAEKNKEADDIFKANKEYIQKLEKERNSVQQELEEEFPVRYIGQALGTYLINECGDELIIIDQHAAHERILFDNFYKLVKTREVVKQSLLIPYTFNTNDEEATLIFDMLELFKEVGFDIEFLQENTFRVYGVPVELAAIDLNAFFKDILTDERFKNEKIPTVVREIIAQKACKSAIKSGDKLSLEEINSLMESLRQNWGLKCPHGRPVAVKISRTEIDKWFKRIL